MSQTEQTLESIRSDFDRIALLSEETRNHDVHYQQYHKFLLNHLPEHCPHILEIGCGTGEFSRLLAKRAEKVLAVDLSPQMIRIARTRSKLYPNIDFIEGDVMTQPLPDYQYDGVATITTLHHLPMTDILEKVKKALKPGGTFICLDLYQRSCLTDLLFDSAAYPASLFLRLIKTGNLRPSKQLLEAYAEHGKTDTYPTLPEIERICTDLLPGARIVRHLFWRYSIIWRKENDE